jgi:hypothetical protein
MVAFGMKIFLESLQPLYCGMENKLDVSGWKRLVDISSGVNISRQIKQRFERAEQMAPTRASEHAQTSFLMLIVPPMCVTSDLYQAEAQPARCPI